MALQYALTIFLSAFLLFQVQPMLGRVVLPWFGGSASVWTVCLLFFQCGLLGGYLYAHALQRYVARAMQPVIHAALLGLSLLALIFISPNPAWKPVGSEMIIPRILGLLLTMIGLPYLLLSATSPLLQAWYAGLAETPEGAKLTYRLYAVSNVGSLLALLSYPVLVEPFLGTRTQLVTWAGGYVVFAVLCASLALQARKRLLVPAEASSDEAAEVEPPTPSSRKWLWLGLSACPSVLLLAVTHHVTQDVAPIPFLWVLPLSLYLISFIIPFAGKSWSWSLWYLPMPALGLAALGLAIADQLPNRTIAVLLGVYCTGLFLCCLTCHGELARLRPAPRDLTAYYLIMAAGGALGGLFVGVLAPVIFVDYLELPLGLAATAILLGALIYRASGTRWWNVAWMAPVLPTLALVFAAVYHSRYGTAGTILRARSFFGALLVRDIKDSDPKLNQRHLINGRINHGAEWLDPMKRLQPLTYYGPKSGVGLAVSEIQAKGPVKIGVVGLGTGTMAGFGRKGDTVRFYEINPIVPQIARSQFNFVTGSPANVETVMGDARLSMEREAPQNYDLLVIDAFTSDSIPIHLLTREAFRLYYRHLKPDGILAVHISNRYLDLKPVCFAAGQEMGKQAKLFDPALDGTPGVWRSVWVLMPASNEVFERKPLKGQGSPLEAKPGFRTWTDDFSNLYQILYRS